MQVLTTDLPNGRPLHVGYDAIARAALDHYHAGRQMGEVPPSKRGVAGRAIDEAYEKARKRGDETRDKLEEAITDAVKQAVDDAWDAAIGTVHPFKCGHCNERFETMFAMIEHSTDARSDPACAQSLEQALRFTSSLAPNGT